MIELLFAIFTVGFSLGMVPAFIYGKIGGDEQFKNKNPIIVKILHYLHHWMLGLAIILITSYYVFLGIISPWSIFLLGFGISMYLDDAFFHSFSNYFQRKA